MRTELPAGTVLRFPDGCAFELLGVMGGGGHALIYEARELGTQLYAAVKEIYPIRGYIRTEGQIRPAGTTTAGMLEKLRYAAEKRETLLSQQAGRRNYQVLNTRGICHQAELRLPGETAPRTVCNTYARMDSLREKGVTLGAHIRRCRENGGLSADAALAVMRTVLDAYAALHEDGFLHGDCQTGNLFLLKAGEAEGPGTACIIDFGSARRLTADGATEEIRDEIYSTDGFCPPELLTRGREPIRLTAACDVWALGVLLLEMLTGRVLDGTEITRFLMTHPREKRLFPDEAEMLGFGPAEADLLNGILKRTLDNDPAARYPNAGALREDLRRLERCRGLDVSAGVDRHLLWESSYRFARKNASLFRTEHVPMLVERLPVKKLTVYGKLNGQTQPAAELLRSLALNESMKTAAPKKTDAVFGDDGLDLAWLDVLDKFGWTPPRSDAPEKNNRHIYLYAPGGAGKSYATAELFNEFLKSGRLVPLYLDLARFTVEAVRVADAPERAVARLLAEQLFDGAQPSAAEELTSLFSEKTDAPRYCLVLDNLHKVEQDAYPMALRAVNRICRDWPAVWLLTAGRAENPVRNEDGTDGEFLPANRVALQFLPIKDMRKLTETVFTESIKALPEDDVYRKFDSAALWGGTEKLRKNRDTLGLPLFFMRYLELLTRDPREIELPHGTAELLAVYFGQREYDANGRGVHDFLRRHMPWVGYQYMRSGQPTHSRAEIAGWLEESYGRLRYRPEHAEAFFHDAVDNLAVLTPAGEDGLRFVHDCYQEYFSAAAIAGSVRQALDEGESRPLRKVNHRWTGKTTELWLNLCAGEVENGHYRRLCEGAEVEESLCELLRADLEQSREEAGCIPENVLYTYRSYHGSVWEELVKELVPGKGFQVLLDPTEGPVSLSYEHAGRRKLLPWMRLAADMGDAKMQFLLGRALWRGIGEDPGDRTDAFAWFRRSAENGHAPAQSVVAYGYEHGLACEEDPAAALTWYHRAAENGQPDALARLALLYVEGTITPCDPEKAEVYLHRLENRKETVERIGGRPALRFSKGIFKVELDRLLGEPGGVEKRIEAAAFYSRASKRDLAKAQYLLGRVFLLGEDTEPDAARGLDWLHKAGGNGNSDAMLLLGVLYEQYADTERGLAAARKWYETAAKRTADPEAAYRLAGLCAKGMGTQACSGVELAVYWYGLAAAGGHPDAQARIDAIFAANPQLAEYLQANPWRVEECCCPEHFTEYWIRRE